MGLSLYQLSARYQVDVSVRLHSQRLDDQSCYRGSEMGLFVVLPCPTGHRVLLLILETVRDLLRRLGKLYPILPGNNPSKDDELEFVNDNLMEL